MKKLSDSSLIRLVKVDNHMAFTILVNRYWEALYKHVWLKIKDRDEAKDIIQDIFLSLWKNRSTIICEENKNIAPYLFRAAKYSVINYFSRPGILITEGNELARLLDFPSSLNTDDPFLLKELQGLVDAEVNNLPERLQAPYRLSREQQLTIKEIAEQLSVSEQTVKNNITTVLNKIRVRLGHYNSDITVCFIVAVAGYLSGN